MSTEPMTEVPINSYTKSSVPFGDAQADELLGVVLKSTINVVVAPNTVETFEIPKATTRMPQLIT